MIIRQPLINGKKCTTRDSVVKNNNMEEKKKVQEATPEMEAPKEKTQKMTYEQLEGIAHQLSEQNVQLVRKLQEANMQNMFARLNYLFKVVEFGARFPKEFLDKSIAEIVSIMTIDEPEVEPEKKEAE